MNGDAGDSPSSDATSAELSRVAILDDEPDVLQVLIAMVEVLGFKPTGFMQSRELIDSISTGEQFDLFLIDHNLTDGLGTDVIDELSTMGVESPAILITGSNHRSTLTLPKPTTLAELKDAMESALVGPD